MNQYKASDYKLKYMDTSNEKIIAINKYSDMYYKIWCVEGESIEVEILSALVSATLSEPFRELLYVMFPG